MKKKISGFGPLVTRADGSAFEYNAADDVIAEVYPDPPEYLLGRLLGGYAGVGDFGVTLDGQVDWKDLPAFIRVLQRLEEKSMSDKKILGFTREEWSWFPVRQVIGGLLTTAAGMAWLWSLLK